MSGKWISFELSEPTHPLNATQMFEALCNAIQHKLVSYTTCHFVNQLYSHRPAFQPVLHLSSHFEQSNSFFPSFLLTSLCASHIHCPNSSLLSVLILFLVMKSWKSSAHTQQGYSFEKSPTNCVTWLCSMRVGETG